MRREQKANECARLWYWEENPIGKHIAGENTKSMTELTENSKGCEVNARVWVIFIFLILDWNSSFLRRLVRGIIVRRDVICI